MTLTIINGANEDQWSECFQEAVKDGHTGINRPELPKSQVKKESLYGMHTSSSLLDHVFDMLINAGQLVHADFCAAAPQ